MSQQQALLACRCHEQCAGWRDLAKIALDVRLHDGSPGANGDVSRRDDICESSEFAERAFEPPLVDAVRGVGTSALRTGDACISWINIQNNDSAESGFVIHEPLQLSERPVAVARPLGPSNRYPIANMGEAFEGDTAIGAFGPTHQLLTYDVVCVSLELGLPASELSEFAVSCASPSPLKVPTTMLKSSSIDLHGFAAVAVPVRIGRQIHDTDVDPKECLGGWRDDLGTLHGQVEEENAIPIHKIGFSLAHGQHWFAARADADWNSPPAAKSQDADSVTSLPAEDSAVISNCASQSEIQSGATMAPSHFNDLPNCANSHLRRQPKSLADLPVGQTLNFNPRSGAGTEGHLRNRVASRIAALKGLKKRARVLTRGFEACDQSKFRTCVLSNITGPVNSREFEP